MVLWVLCPHFPYPSRKNIIKLSLLKSLICLCFWKIALDAKPKLLISWLEWILDSGTFNRLLISELKVWLRPDSSFHKAVVNCSSHDKVVWNIVHLNLSFYHYKCCGCSYGSAYTCTVYQLSLSYQPISSWPIESLTLSKCFNSNSVCCELMIRCAVVFQKCRETAT